MEKGGSGIYTEGATGLNETKKGGETSKSKLFDCWRSLYSPFLKFVDLLVDYNM